MTDLKRDVEDSQGIKKAPSRRTQPGKGRQSHTAGTDRDFDPEQHSANQAHGHRRDAHRPQTEGPAKD